MSLTDLLKETNGPPFLPKGLSYTTDFIAVHLFPVTRWQIDLQIPSPLWFYPVVGSTLPDHSNLRITVLKDSREEAIQGLETLLRIVTQRLQDTATALQTLFKDDQL